MKEEEKAQRKERAEKGRRELISILGRELSYCANPQVALVGEELTHLVEDENVSLEEIDKALTVLKQAADKAQRIVEAIRYLP